MYKKLAHLFKEYFIPHEHNNYNPHILRPEATVFILILVALAEFAFLAQIFIFSSGKGILAQILENVLIEQTNANRLADNIPVLESSPLLSVAARAKAEDMAKKSYFAHTSPEGITPWYWLNEVGYGYSYAGENLAINFSDSQDVVDAWMNSPGHKENILNNHFTEIGIGTAQGIYQNKETTFVVQFFGKPLKEKAAAMSSSKSSVPVIVATSSVEENQQTFIAVKNTSTKPEVLSAGTESAKTISGNNLFISSFSGAISEIISSPQTRTKYVYFIMLAFIFLALVLNIFIKVKIQHPRAIANGVILILIINTVLFVNSYLFSTSGQIF